MKVVWADAFVEESNLTNNVYALRKLLGPDENGRSYIETVPKRGYRFTAPVKELPPETVVVEKRTLTRVVTEETVTDDPARPPLISAGKALAVEHESVQGANRSMAPWPLIALLSVSLGVAGFFIYRAVTAKPGTQIQSIAVLPFQHEKGNADIEYLSEGVTESLINRLSQLPGIKVIARSSSFKYKGKDVDVEEVGRSLGVEAILIGRVSQRGDDLLISTELVNVRDKTQVWGGKYQRRIAETQTVPEEISLAISEQLRLELTGAQERQLTKRVTQNPQAYQLYLNGLFYFRKGGSENVTRAIEYFNQAVALDPNFALAWAEIGNAYFGFAGTGLNDPKEALPKAKAAAQRALALDETLAGAHSVLAGIKQDEWEWAEAERGHRRAIELNPNLADAHHKYARYLSVMGRHGEALTKVKRAQELDPLRLSLVLREGIILYLARRYDEAINKFQNVLELQPDYAQAHEFLGLAYEAKGMYQQAMDEYERALRSDQRIITCVIFRGYALAKLGRKSEALVVLNELKNTKDYVSPTVLAVLYIGLGDSDGAITALESGYAARDLQLQYLKVVPHYDGLRSDPRFQDLLRRVGLS